VVIIKDDLEMIVREVPHAREVKVYPISDVHYGSIACMEKAWYDFCGKIAKEDNAYIILGGDMINNNTRSSVGSPWDDYIRPRDQKREMARFLEPLKDKLLCAVGGNHERRSAKDSDYDPMLDIMAKLDLEDLYRPNAAFLKLKIGKRGSEPNKARVAYTIAVTHGSGGGMYTGASVNRNERFGTMCDGIDGLIVGHSHKGAVSKPSKIVVDSYNEVITIKPFVVVGTTAWQSWGGYAAQKMLQPAATDRQVLLLSGDKNSKQIQVVW
jgi:predicted phosphodiesterase